jgi:hypothetical protein
MPDGDLANFKGCDSYLSLTQMYRYETNHVTKTALIWLRNVFANADLDNTDVIVLIIM